MTYDLGIIKRQRYFTYEYLPSGATVSYSSDGYTNLVFSNTGTYTVNFPYALSPSIVNVAVIGAGGGGGGADSGANGTAGGAAGAVITGTLIISPYTAYTIAVGGGGQSGLGPGQAAAGGGAGGTNGGGPGGNAGGTPSSGGGGGGGGWSGIYTATGYLVVAGGGAGAGGADEGLANDVPASGGGYQPSGANGTSFIGGPGANYSGDGGGGGGGGGGYYGGLGQSLVGIQSGTPITSSYASGGGNYYAGISTSTVTTGSGGAKASLSPAAIPSGAAGTNSISFFDTTGTYGSGVAGALSGIYATAGAVILRYKDPNYLPNKENLQDSNIKYTTLILSDRSSVTSTATNNRFLDSSFNNFSITTPNGIPGQGSFSPYGPNWSVFFNGTTDYLSIPQTTNLTFGSGASVSPMTAEAWFYTTTTPTTNQTVVSQYASGSSGWSIRLLSGVMRVALTGDTTLISGTTTLAANTWYHAALSGSVGSWKLFLNGVQEGATQTGSVTMGDGAVVQIGRISTVDYFNGYISNVRIIKGTALYTSTFTTPTAPLSVISTQTGLLICGNSRFVDASGTTATFTIAGTPSIHRFSPFPPQGTYSSLVQGGSAYFNGTTDYLRKAGAGVLATAGGDLTIETWIYSFLSSIIGLYDGGTGEVNVIRNINANKFGYQGNDGAGANITGLFPLNAWFHLVITYSSVSPYIVRAYINGKLSSTGTAGVYAVGSNFDVGTINSGAGGYFTGYISNFRVTNSLVYTTGSTTGTVYFSPPLSPLRTINTSTSTSLLLNFTNAGIIDQRGNISIATVNAATLSTATVRRNVLYSKSMYFNGVISTALRATNISVANFSAGNFTAEGWFYFTTNSIGYQPLLANTGLADTNGWILITETTNIIYAYFATGGGSWTYTLNSTVIPTINVWTHLALVRYNGTISLFINGVSKVTASAGTTALQTTTSSFYVGYYPYFSSGARSFSGYVDDVRLTKMARYTTSTFTPPTSIPIK